MIGNTLAIEREALRARALLYAPVMFACGIGAYFLLPREVAMGPILSLTLAMVVLALALQRRFGAPILIGTALILAGFTHAGLRASRVGAPLITEGIHNISGAVIGQDRSQSGRLRLLLGDLYINGLAPADTPVRIRITVSDAARRHLPGTRVMVRAKLSPPSGPVEPDGFDFRRYAWFRQMGGVGFTLSPVMQGPDQTSGGAMAAITSIRLRAATAISDTVGGRSGGFAAAIFTGDRSRVDRASLDDLRASNLAHLLAISGLHMGLLTGFVFAMVRMALAATGPPALHLPAKKLAAVAAILAGAAYLVMSGASVATQRAFVMAFVMFGAVLLDRRAVTLRAVAIAAMIILLIRPESLTGAGFQMSFAATCALVAGFEMLQNIPAWRAHQKHWLGRFGKGALALAFSSMLAGAATAPFSAYHFNAVAQYGLLANVISVPIMGFIVMPAGALAGMFAPLGLEGPFLWVAGMGIAAILNVAHWVAGFEDARVLLEATDLTWLLCVVAGGLAVILLASRFRYAGLVLVAIGLFMWSSPERPSVLISADAKISGVMTDAGRALSRARGAGFVANSWLENDGDGMSQKQAANRDVVDQKWQIFSDGQLMRCEIDLPCAAFDLAAYKGQGAIAIFDEPQGPRIVTVAARVGQRHWTRAAPRSKLD